MAGWPGDEPFALERMSDMASGAEYNLSKFRSSAHVGTHMDAPLHFVNGAQSIDQFPLEVGIGRVRVVAIENPTEIALSEVEHAGIREGERVLFRTHNSDNDWGSMPFNQAFIAIPEDTAEFLAERRPALVGVDYLSVAPFNASGPTHREILGAGIWVIEGLYLASIAAGEYDMVCLPLKLFGAEGSPARVALRKS